MTESPETAIASANCIHGRVGLLILFPIAVLDPHGGCMCRYYRKRCGTSARHEVALESVESLVETPTGATTI
jgi:hypothetical protein